MTKNLKAILRRTSELVGTSSRSSDPSGHAGPLTYSCSFEDIIEDIETESPESEILATSCAAMKEGLFMRRISRRKQVQYFFKLEDDGAIVWKDRTKRLPLDSIKDVRTGDMARNYREQYGVSSKVENLWITVIYHVSGKLKALHVVTRNKEEFDIFFHCICGLIKSRRELMESMSVPDNEKFANIHWHATVSRRKEDETKDTLTFEDVRRLCDRFHIYCSSNHLRKFFVIADVNNNGLLNFQEFQTFVTLLKTRHEVKQLWSSIAGGRNGLSLKQFHRFLREEQGEDVSDKKASAIYYKFKQAKDGDLTYDAFIKYLGAQPYAVELKEDYNKPLNQYFIASSHNTYLLGKQVGETPSVEGYMQALQQGCRCIEIDIWDDDLGPVVCHGFLTAAIPLVNVVEIIRKYAFITSPYPLIISLEINCNKENQAIAGSIFINSFGAMLYQKNEEFGILPSPMELRHKILLKVKKTTKLFKVHSSDSQSGSTLPLDNVSSYSSSYESEHESPMKLKDAKTASSANLTSIRRIRRMKLRKGVEVGDILLAISAIYGLKFRNFSLPESKTTSHCFSLNERKVESMCNELTQELCIDKHNRRHLMRVYPHAFRYRSTNFNPIKFWKLGVQFVALNWQTNDLGQQINLAMFQLNNQKDGTLHSGYVLKPRALINPAPKLQDIPGVYERYYKDLVHVHLKVLSAQLLPKPTETRNGSEEGFAPYIEIEYVGDEESLQPIAVLKGSKLSPTVVITEMCKENGFNPIWDTEIHLQLRHTDFAFVKFQVKTGETVLAMSCLKLDYLKRGYRHIPLYNQDGELYIFSTLFIYSQVS
ncbi:PLC1 (YPL268W) [Zygosaccharomyces parabailii]|nr:PLC1 (YPL268W) [Zygosaccharomyces parabailii]